MSQLPSLLLLLAAAGAALVFVEALIRRSDVGAIVVLGVFVAATVLDSSLVLVTSPVTIFVEDPVYGAILVATVARFLRVERLTPLQLCLVAFGIIAVVALVRGVPEFGAQSAANEFRKVFRFAAAALYFSTVASDRRLLDRIGMLWLLAAGAIAALTVLRWLAMAAGVSGGIFGLGLIRAVPSTPTLVLLQGFFIALPLWRNHPSVWLRQAAPVFLVLVVLLQHRSVWISLLVGLTVWLVRDRALRQRIAAVVVAAALGGLVLGIAVFDEPEMNIADQLTVSATDSRTFSWRYEGWVDLLSTSGPQEGTEVLLGMPYGSGFGRQVDGQTVEVSPHSHYIETFLRQGAIGLFLLALIYAGAFRRLFGPSPAPGSLLSNDVLLVLLVTQIVHAIPYALTTIQGLPLGIAIAASMGAAQSRSASQRPAEVASG